MPKPNISDVKSYFQQFIKSEDDGLAQNEQGDFYPSNWHRPENNLALAAKALSADELQRVYFHKIRLGYLATKDIVPHFDLWLSAYKQLLPINYIANKFNGLFAYGFNAETQISTNDTVEDCMHYTAALTQFSKFSNLPNMLKKPEKFYAYGCDEKVVNRCIHTLSALNYLHDEEYMTCPAFQGAIFTLMLSQLSQAKTFYEDFKKTAPKTHESKSSYYAKHCEEAANKYLSKL